MPVDTSGLAKLGQASSTTPAAAAADRTGGGQLQRESDANADAIKRAQEVYNRYQEAQRTVGSEITQIRKGVHTGENISTLFLQALSVIEKLSGEPQLVDAVAADLVSIYGIGLHETEPLQQELQDVQQRLEKLQQAEAAAEAEDADRIRRAIRAHTERAAQLQELIRREG